MWKIFLKSENIWLEISNFIKENQINEIIISSEFLSLENIIFFYTRILPTILIEENIELFIYPYFTELKKMNSISQWLLILLYEENFKNKILEMYEQNKI